MNDVKDKHGQLPVIRFDGEEDEEYPNGAWFCTVDDPEGGYDRYYGNTPNEAFEKWKNETF
jgi:hypothetical protein